MDLHALTREMPEDERPRLLAHLLALGPEDRRLRFGHLLSDDGIAKYVESIDLSHDVVFVVTGPDLAIIGAAHLVRRESDAELGVSVLPEHRGHGIGAALLERAAARVRNWGVRVLFMNCLVENDTMMSLARKQGMKIVVSGTDAEAFVKLPRADLASFTAEAVAEHLGLFDHALKAGWRALHARRGAPPDSPGA
ncbi:MAG: GNAT family N-acetyltransferase [Xanthobacteraceae bacterium]|nr:GNAT family N-acetyltransferase [Xanthobacteraceae bacterium]